MNRRVQVVDELRADVLAREHEPEAPRARRARRRRRPRRTRRPSSAAPHRARCAQASMTGLKPSSAATILSRYSRTLRPAAAPLSVCAALRRVREHELVAGLDRLDALLQDRRSSSSVYLPAFWIVVLVELSARDPTEDHRARELQLLGPQREVDVHHHHRDEHERREPVQHVHDTPRRVGEQIRIALPPRRIDAQPA